jgi:hypothetical protein
MTTDEPADAVHPPDAVPGDAPQPSNQPIDEQVRTVPLDDDDNPDRVVPQQSTGPGNREGSGEWPDPHTPPRGPAPGTAEDAAPPSGRRLGGDEESIKDVLNADPVAGGSGSGPEEG